MGKAFSVGRNRGQSRGQLDWRKRMSDTVAYALLVYTGLQIFVTMQAIEGDSASALPMLALVVLVGAIIPMFRRFERRWEHIGDAAAADPGRRAAFRKDQVSIWLLAIGLPFLLTGLFKLIAALF
ncbi:hypothetical protein [Novosphingobium sp. EMRT-2]|uniref:hypothetical protein n=1 Tax=Novosphingobium sp. EMRT-2 TaxID=2571749 RepID=UPI0010BDB5FD|nr:hypothetical protein [Novosphingobium sp. EMRT-2]QCI94018.1 hypothetical protein FA702_10980 [Novosphingobium sp. EMRT-2]